MIGLGLEGLGCVSNWVVTLLMDVAIGGAAVFAFAMTSVQKRVRIYEC